MGFTKAGRIYRPMKHGYIIFHKQRLHPTPAQQDEFYRRMQHNQIALLNLLHDQPMHRDGVDVNRISWNEDMLVSQAKSTSSPHILLWYASYVLRGRFSKGEDIISQYAYPSDFYAIRILKQRFPKGEPTISKNAYCSYQYARYLIKGRWEPGEAAIGQSPEVEVKYAKFLNSLS